MQHRQHSELILVNLLTLGSMSTRDLVVWPDGDAVTGVHEPLAVVAAHDGCASCLAVDGDTVATAGFDGFVRVWALNIASPAPQLRMTRLVRPFAAPTAPLPPRGLD